MGIARYRGAGCSPKSSSQPQRQKGRDVTPYLYAKCINSESLLGTHRNAGAWENPASFPSAQTVIRRLLMQPCLNGVLAVSLSWRRSPHGMISLISLPDRFYSAVWSWSVLESATGHTLKSITEWHSKIRACLSPLGNIGRQLRYRYSTDLALIVERFCQGHICHTSEVRPSRSHDIKITRELIPLVVNP